MKLPRDLSGDRLIRALCREWGYRQVRQVGSHVTLETDQPWKKMSTSSSQWVALLSACLVVTAALACAETTDRLVGEWAAGEDTSMEFFEDGTCVLVEEGERLAGTYRLLQDGRLKMDFEALGTPTILTFSNLEVSADELAMTFERSGERWVLERVDTRAKVAAKAEIVNNQKAQRRTVGDMRQVGTAWFSWLTDQISAGAAGQSKTYEIGELPKIRAEGLLETLHPSNTFFYIQHVPETDGWGNRYEYRFSGDPLAPKVMAIRSAGSDGEFDDTEYPVGPFPATDYAQDIVWADGFFVRYPKGSKNQ